MKNFLVLILTAIVFSGCGFSNQQKEQQKKQELKSHIHKLEQHQKQLIEQKFALQKQIRKTVIKYDHVLQGKYPTETERQTIQEQFDSDLYKIELKQVKLEKQRLETKLKIRKLELEYAKLTRKSKFGIAG